MSASAREERVWGELQIRLPKKMLEDMGNTSEANQNEENCFKRIIPLTGEKFVIGRADDCNYQLVKKMVSSRHCYLKEEGGVVYLVDTSQNGTFINKQKKISKGEYHILKDNDEIYLISKKGDPHTDFCLIFKSRFDQNDRPTSNNEPNAKRIKLEPLDALAETCVVKQEPFSHSIRCSDTDDENDVVCLDSTNQNASRDKKNGVTSAKSHASVTKEPVVGNASNIPWDEFVARANKNESSPGSESIHDASDVVHGVDTDSVDTIPLLGVSGESSTIDVTSDEVSDSIENELLQLEKECDGDHVVGVGDDNVEDTLEKELLQLDHDDEDKLKPKLVTNDDNVATKSVKPSSQKDGMEETLQCSLCIEILFEPVCCQPCLHCYCAGCYSQWMQKSSCCPQCRVFVESVSKNHIVSNMVEEFIKANPAKKRSDAEIKRLQSLSVITQDVMKFSKKDEKFYDSDYDTSDDDNSYSDNSLGDPNDGDPNFTFNFPGGVLGLHIPTSTTAPTGRSRQICRQCPSAGGNCKGKKGGKGKGGASCAKGSASSHASTSADNVPQGANANANAQPSNGYVCKTGQVHISCQCCQTLMPDRRAERNDDSQIPPQKCCECSAPFCNLYYEGGCTSGTCNGCLILFKNLQFNDLDLVRAINDNIIESRILLDYLSSVDKTWASCFEECLEALDSGRFKVASTLTSNSVICHSCGLRKFKTLLYLYRKEISADLLPQEVQRRPDCYWGKNCRTQKHKMSHAERFNHICEQTRFNH